jgi:hypothetical protein
MLVALLLASSCAKEGDQTNDPATKEQLSKLLGDHPEVQQALGAIRDKIADIRAGKRRAKPTLPPVVKKTIDVATVMVIVGAIVIIISVIGARRNVAKFRHKKNEDILPPPAGIREAV